MAVPQGVQLLPPELTERCGLRFLVSYAASEYLRTEAETFLALICALDWGLTRLPVTKDVCVCRVREHLGRVGHPIRHICESVLVVSCRDVSCVHVFRKETGYFVKW